MIGQMDAPMCVFWAACKAAFQARSSIDSEPCPLLQPQQKQL